MPKKKNRAAVALGRLGGRKGGAARMKSMTAAERSALGRRAEQKRWSKDDAAMSLKDLSRLVERVAKEQARLQPLLPDIDPHDLRLILSCMLRPLKDRRYFIRRAKKHRR